MGIERESIDPVSDPPPHERLGGGWQEVDRVHPSRLDAKLPLEILPADTLLICRLGESSANLVEVPRILDRLEQIQILDGDNGRDPPAVTSQHHALAAERHAIDRRRKRLSHLADSPLAHVRIVRNGQ
jgi:hypothetical protein